MNEVFQTKGAPSDLEQTPSGNSQGMNEAFPTKGAPSDLVGDVGAAVADHLQHVLQGRSCLRQQGAGLQRHSAPILLHSFTVPGDHLTILRGFH